MRREAVIVATVVCCLGTQLAVAEATADWKPHCSASLNAARTKWIAKHPQFKRVKVATAESGVWFKYIGKRDTDYEAHVEENKDADRPWTDIHGDQEAEVSQARIAGGKVATLVIFDFNHDKLVSEFVATFRPALDSCLDQAVAP